MIKIALWFAMVSLFAALILVSCDKLADDSREPVRPGKTPQAMVWG